jgi:UDP-N-acetylmuramoyl-tripeptide--D-alanyl-D-alanine ligase
MRLVDSPPTAAGNRVPAQIRIDDLLAATGGRLQATTSVRSFSLAVVDSRRVVPGSLFVALRGERDDGHRYVAQALAAGAVAAIVEQDVTLPATADAAIVRVADSLRALQDLASWWRERFAVRVVGITGSTGKTLAKEVTADVLSRTMRVLRNEGNLNSETGLPMTLLHLDPTHQVAVLEMGMYAIGEIARLVEISRPEVGVVLAVHPTHLQRAGSLENIAEAKSELPRGLPADGLAVLNADDPRVAAMAAHTPATVRTFGLTDTADVRATDVVSDGLDGVSFTLTAPWGDRRMRSASPGRHLVPHALAAAAVAEHFAVPMAEVASALEAGSHAPHRMAITEMPGGATLVDDTYNASPISVSAALTFLAETPIGSGKRYAVLGDMLELGPDEQALHERIGREAADVVDGLVGVGERGRWIADAARGSGLPRVATAEDAESALPVVEQTLAPAAGDVLLVKASRGLALDRLVAALTGKPPDDHA